MDDGVLRVEPWAAAAVMAVLLVALFVPPPAGRPEPLRIGGAISVSRWGAPAAALLVVVLVLVSRLGPRSELENPVPALVVGIAWPLVLVLPGLLGLAVHRRRRDAAEPTRDVRPAVGAATAVTGYLVLAPSAAVPVRLATALAAYGLVVVAVGVALGRAAAARTEVLGLLARWSWLGPSLVRWHPPRGAAAVLCVVLGGAWAERLQRSSWWAGIGAHRPGQVLLLLAAAAVAGLAAIALTRWSDGRAAPVLLPLAAAAVLAGVLRRLLISVQLLADLAGASQGISPDPLGAAGGQGAALAVVVAGGALASAVLARRVGGGAARLPGVGVVLAVTAVTSVVVLQP